MEQQHNNVKRFFSPDAAFATSGAREAMTRPDPGLCIRRAKAQESDCLAAIAKDAYAHYVPRMDKLPFPMLDNYEQHTKAGNAWVLALNEEIASYIIMIPKPAY